VRKTLLRPCIALTSALRDGGSVAPEVTVNVDTLTFDRVLLFLEAEAQGRPPPTFGVHLLEPLLAAKRGDSRLGLGARDGSSDTAFLADFLSAKYASGSRQ